MKNVPEILNNPNNPSFNLIEEEIYSLKEAKELIEIDKLSFSFFAIWNCVLINLQRRVEYFGIKNFLPLLKTASLYNKDANTLKERWLKINEFELIDYVKKLNLINNITNELIKTLYWIKTNINDNKNFSKEELHALIYLLERNLFLYEFKEDKRINSDEDSSQYKRRKEDKEEKIIHTTTTHQELVLKNGVKHFENNLETNNKNDKLLTAYI